MRDVGLQWVAEFQLLQINPEGLILLQWVQFVIVKTLMRGCPWLGPILLLVLELFPFFLPTSTDTKYLLQEEGQDEVDVVSVDGR